MRILYSPLYYPRVGWWEYDYRIKKDMKVKTKFNGDETQGRITDLRMKAGCLISFDKFQAGDHIELIIDNLKYEILVCTHRRVLLGRPEVYGFVFKRDKDKVHYNEVKQIWKSFIKAC